VDATIIARSDDEPAVSELEVEEKLDWPIRLGDQIPPGDTGVRDPVGHELRDILGADEQGFELAAEGCSEGALTAAADFEAGIGKQLAGGISETALIGKSDAKHGGGVGGEIWVHNKNGPSNDGPRRSRYGRSVVC
jgi:hypothetical protein